MRTTHRATPTLPADEPGGHDPVTGLPNRVQFVKRMKQLMPGVGHRRNAALLLVDLDRFGLLNASLGHDAGDNILELAAQQIRTAAGADDTVARLGGDEFLVLCMGADADVAGAIAERIRQAFHAPVTVNGSELQLTVSVGIASVAHDKSPTDTIREADAAKRHAKRHGGNQSSLFETAHNVRAPHVLDLDQALRKALVRDEFVLHFQPIYSVADGSLRGAEALVRWNRPGYGLVSPDDFIPAVERAGLMHALGDWVLNDALRQMRTWKQQGCVPPGFAISVNLAPVQLQSLSLVGTIEELLAKHQLDPADLTLEVTETAPIAELSRMQSTVDRLAAAGIALSIDDFGTGYSSLRYLRYLPARELKIDRTFVAELTTSGRGAALVSAVIGLAHAFGMRCVAEGVETSEQLDHLRRLDCDLAQGYFLARPSPAAELTEAWGPAS